MAQRRVTRDIPRLSLRASFEPGTIDVERRTCGLVWTTGARVKRGLWDPYYEELSLDPKHVRMERLQSGAAPLLNNHGTYDVADVIGVVESAALERSRGTAVVRFDSGPEGESAFRKVRDGILRNVSVGYATHRMEKIEDGEDVVPVFLAVDWEPHEISLVPIGADAGAVTRSGVATTPCEFIEEKDDMPDPVIPTPAPAPTLTPVAPPVAAPVPALGDQRSERELERERVLQIQRAGKTLQRPETEINEAIRTGVTLDAYRAAAIDALANASPENGGPIPFAKRSTDSMITVGVEARDKYLQGAENWILQRAGLTQLVIDGAAKRGEKKPDLDPGESRGMTLVEMARDSLERNGVRTRGMDAMQMVGTAFMHRSGGMMSTSDFAVVLESAMNKTMLAAYATTPDTWRRWAAKGSVSDFRPHLRYRQGSFGVLETVLEGGEYKNAPIPDGERQPITASTKGRIVAITRQAIINDDLGAFTDVSTRLGRAAALTVEVDAFAYLLSNPVMADGLTLFHANHGNIGTGSALSVAALDADRVLLGSQLDPSKNEMLELKPAILMVPLGLGGAARVINQAQYNTDKLANGRMQEPNMVVGLFSDIIDTGRLTGTTRYLLADPNIAPVIEVAFLNGNETPYLETKEGWRIDGTEWKARLDYGIAARDWRGIVRNAGA